MYRTRKQPPLERVHSEPRKSYYKYLTSTAQTGGPAAPKSKLLVSDLDNTLYAPLSHDGSLGVRPRPYLRTFLEYILHPKTPYNLAVWTFAQREWGIAHLRTLDIPSLFEDESLTQPLLAPGVLSFWGYQDSGLTKAETARDADVPCKDLQLLWDMLNARKEKGMPDWSPLNSLIIDDQISNAAAQPDSIIVPPLFLETTERTDFFLLQIIGALDHLAREDNFAFSIQEAMWEKGLPELEHDHLAERGRIACAKYGITVARGRDSALPERASILLKLSQPWSPPDIDTPDEEVPDITKAHDDIKSFNRLLACCQAHPSPTTSRRSAPASANLLLFPNELYEKEAAQPSEVMKKPKKPLVVFELDGTLYARPPCHANPVGEPVPRPYLLTFLSWLLRPSSPWSVAFWTTVPKSMAIRSLIALGLGLVGPDLVGPDKMEAELLHPRLVAFWAREDLGLDKKEFQSFVTAPKDLDMLWEHLEVTGIGCWSAYNTVMVDHSSLRLPGQPDSLIRPTCFHYPMAPSDQTSVELLDTFLFQLVAVLAELSVESNFASYIAHQGWANGIDDRDHELARKSLRILSTAGVSALALATGRVVIPTQDLALIATMPEWSRFSKAQASFSRQGLATKIGVTMNYRGSSGSPNTLNTRHHGLAQSIEPTGTSLPLQRDAQPWRPSFSSAIAPPGASTLRPESTVKPIVLRPISLLEKGRPALPRFVVEEQELARLHNRKMSIINNSRDQLSAAVRDWELTPPDLSIPLSQFEPYEEPDGIPSYRQDFFNPEGF